MGSVAAALGAEWRAGIQRGGAGDEGVRAQRGRRQQPRLLEPPHELVQLEEADELEQPEEADDAEQLGRLEQR